jgi:hypothetical protein
MAYQKDIIQAQKGNLSMMETKLLGLLVESLPEPYTTFIKNQIPYFKRLLRLEFKNNSVLELYPESYGIIPEEYLLRRKEEFEFAKLFFEINRKKYCVTFYAVSGSLFDLNVKPKILDENSEIAFRSIRINADLEENVYEKRRENGEKIRDKKL